MSYPTGQRLHFAATFSNGVVGADPDTVRFRIEHPDGTVESFEYGVDSEVVRTGVGAYNVEIVTDAGGFITWRWEGSGDGVDTAVEGAVAVTLPRVVATP